MKDIALAANIVRGLAMDGVQAANSGHPGMPMGTADLAATLFLKHLAFAPSNPDWADRDRFVLSAGHGSMLLYSLLHLSGYDVPLDELKKFRQWESLTPGHPERGHTPGVEATTGPLGQGCSNMVGMAIAERLLAERFNTDDMTLVDHNVYAICSDGDLMEGLSHESLALAGHLKLDKITLIYDSNSITIEGSTDLAYSDDVKKRFESYHWNVIEVDGHNLEQIDKALADSRAHKGAPTIIIATTRMGKGSPNLEGTSTAHGAPLGDDEVKLTKEALGLPGDELFYVPQEVRDTFAARQKEGEARLVEWNALYAQYEEKYPEKAAEWNRCMAGELPADIESNLPEFSDPVATRAASGKVLQSLAASMPELIGGSADLEPSNKTELKEFPYISADDFSGRNFHFGVREHGMAAIMNGIAQHGGFRVFGGTFLVFLDYCRPSVRLAAIMGLPTVYVFTHDSIYVGEDGPTHQPVEQLASLRCIPNVTAIRPAEATETAAAWVAAMKNTTGPTALLLTRQNLPVLDRTEYPPANELEKGAYTLWQNGEGVPDMILLASGSEVQIVLDAAKAVADDMNVRVVSMPSWELFEKQDDSYKQDVLPAGCTKRLAVEAGATIGWKKYVGDAGRVFGLDCFGKSGPYKELAAKYGFTADNIISIVEEMA